MTLSFCGLFFRPMHEDSLSTYSFKKAWSRYLTVRLRDANHEASSRTSYFGTDLLSFAVRYRAQEVFVRCRSWRTILEREPVSRVLESERRLCLSQLCLRPLRLPLDFTLLGISRVSCSIEKANNLIAVISQCTFASIFNRKRLDQHFSAMLFV